MLAVVVPVLEDCWVILCSKWYICLLASLWQVSGNLPFIFLFLFVGCVGTVEPVLQVTVLPAPWPSAVQFTCVQVAVLLAPTVCLQADGAASTWFNAVQLSLLADGCTART